MTLPAQLKPAREARIDAWRAAAGERSLSAEAQSQLPTVMVCSDYVARQCTRRPEVLLELDRSGRLQGPDSDLAVLLREDLAAGARADEATQLKLLRRLRHRELVRIAWRDIAAVATTTQTLDDISAVATALIQTACAWAQASAAVRQNGVEAPLVVVAMGKLGGGELNFSSDIDLVFLHEESTAHPEAYFVRAARRLIHLLGTPTEDGFVYRVDTRLRPFGSTGALAASYDGFEAYLQQHGREWERYAYVKARPVTGGAAALARFEGIVRPFVYRRYIDYGVLESLREMKALIAADVVRRERRDDIKLGPGGIREVEFIVQAFQLLRGGADPALRNPALQAVLPLLVERRWLQAQQARSLQEAYLFLRKVENRLQQWRDEQVHALPREPVERARLAFSLGFDSWDALSAELERQRDVVSRQFRDTIVADDDNERDEQADVLAAIWKNDSAQGTATGRFEAMGFADAKALQERLRTLHDSGLYQRLDQRGRERLDVLIPRVLRAAAASDDADAVVGRLLRIIDAVGRRSAYYALLTENPAVLDRLADLAASSPWVARRVAESPILLDELIDPRMFEQPPTRADFVADLEQRFAGVAGDDLERQMEALREFKHASEFRVAVTDLSGVLPLMKVSDRLTDIAELVLERVIALSSHEMRSRYGCPRTGGRAAGFAAVGYGKLGGLELGYPSDLDVVFLHDSEALDAHTDGERALDNVRYFARLGQRILHMLNTATVAGVLYEVDLRLRPSGKGGPLVSPVGAFERYQRESAWTWEHQALLRARAVAGEPAVRERFEQVRTAVLTRQRDRNALREDVTSMRERMRSEHGEAGPGLFDIKRGRGGLTDIEFIVQFLVLAHAAGVPALVRYSDNIRQLEALAAAGLFDSADAVALTDIYRAYRQRLHRLALADAAGVVAADEFAPQRERVGGLWERVFA